MAQAPMIDARKLVAPTEREKHFVLPSGRAARVRSGVGRDLLAASRAGAGRAQYALLAELATIDGAQLTLDEIDAMPLPDLLALQSAHAEFLPERK